MTDYWVIVDEWMTALGDVPPVEFGEDRLSDGTVLIHFRDPGPPYVGGGTLVIPASTVSTA